MVLTSYCFGLKGAYDQLTPDALPAEEAAMALGARLSGWGAPLRILTLTIRGSLIV